MAGEYTVPLLLVALFVLAIASWRVVHPPLALGLTLAVVVSATAYVLISVLPRFVAAIPPSDVPDVAAAPFRATARDARPNDMAIQLYRGAQLLGECSLAGPEAAKTRPTEPLRLERRADGSGFQVWGGATLIGDLPQSALAAVELVQASARDQSLSRAARAGPPAFFITGKVAVGESYSLGELPSAGVVTVEFVRLNERGLAEVKVNAPQLGAASPPILELVNKGALTQSFERMEFDVAIREASFVTDPPWAAFALMAHSVSGARP